MSPTTRIGAADDFGQEDADRLARWDQGPCASIFLPTHRAGPQTRQDPIRLGNLLDEAAEQLQAAGLEEAEAAEVLEPHRALLDDEEVWRHLSDGFALFAAPGFAARYRVPEELAEEVAVGPVFRLRPLLGRLAADGRWWLLALAQNEVRLFSATASTITEVDRGPIPASMAEALAHEDPERQLQFRSGGGASPMYHGHGAGDEVDKQAAERFLRAVDHGLMEVVGDDRAPLVLACVARQAALFRSITRYPRVVEGCVEGSPEERGPGDLHADAWPLAAGALAAPRQEALERIRGAAGALVATDADAVLEAAGAGRVDALFVADPDPAWGERAGEPAGGDTDALDLVVVRTLAASGAVHVLDEPALPGHAVAALLRY
jgi:hypothetical protein